jgi:hypothetical protein
VGDFVRYSLDANKEISNIELVYTDNSFIDIVSAGVFRRSAAVKKMFGSPGEGVEMAAQTYAALYRVVGKSGNLIEARQMDKLTEESEYHLGAMYNVYRVDLEDVKNPVIKAGPGDVTAEDVNAENSVALIFMQWAEPRCIFVLRNSPYVNQ